MALKNIPRKGQAAMYICDDEIGLALDAWAAKLNAANPFAAPWGRTTLAKAVLRRGIASHAEKGEQP